MNIEYEATFGNIDKDEVRIKLQKAGADLVKEEFLQKRHTFHLSKNSEFYEIGWIRLRDEDDKMTLTLKVRGDGENIDCQKELEVEIDDYDQVREMLRMMGCKEKSYQETKREIWKLNNVEVMFDDWPFLEPLIEIEGKSENEVKQVSEKLGFDYNKAIFGPVGILYSEKYNISEEVINNEISEIVFGGDNPFIKKYEK